MDEKRFWDIIAAGCRRDIEVWNWRDSLVSVLRKLSRKEIVAFDRWFFTFFTGDFRFDLWQCGYFMNPGCSDDDLTSFRCWLVCSGKKVYAAALANPDGLADGAYTPDDCWVWLGGLGSVAGAWVRLAIPGAAAPRWARLNQKNSHLAGEQWDIEDREEFRRRFPRLAARYLDVK